jgi:mono/diheme cytochrome c family protein
MKKTLRISSFIVAFLFIGAIAGYIYILKAFPKVGPAPELKISVTPELVKRGEYLFNHVTACADCHSTRDYSKYAGPVVPGTIGKGGFEFNEEFGLPGKFYAKNITPASLSNWTDGEIFRAITEGVDKNNEPLFPLMPFLSFGKMAKEDIYAIIAYMRTLQPIENNVSASRPSFPMNIIMRTIPQKNELQSIPDKSNSIEYGKYLVSASGCNDCHTPQEKGEFKMDKYLSGGQEYKLPGNVIVRPANITPHRPSGIGDWTKEQFILKFKSFREPEYKAPEVKEGGFNTFMPWTFFAGMTDEDLGAIYDYLMTVKPINNNVVKFEKVKD